MGSDYYLQQKKSVKQLEDSFAKDAQKLTVVEMQKDYASDDQICLTSVVFIPDKISSEIVDNVINTLKEIESHHFFYPPTSMHLTIKNIRTVHKPPLFTEAQIHKVDQLFNKIIPEFPVFEFSVEDVLVFPTSISIMAYSDDTLQKLVSALDKGLQEIGVPDNKKYLSHSVFWGNITICRFTQEPQTKFIDEVNKMRNVKIGTFEVDEVHLITSNAVCHPDSRKIRGAYTLK